MLDFISLLGAFLLLSSSYPKPYPIVSKNKLLASILCIDNTLLISTAVGLDVALPLVLVTISIVAEKYKSYLEGFFLVTEYYDDTNLDENTPSLSSDDDDDNDNDIEDYSLPEVIPHRFIPRIVNKPAAVEHQTFRLKTFERALNHFNWTSFAPIILVEDVFEFTAATEVNLHNDIARKIKGLPATKVFKPTNLAACNSTRTSKSFTSTRIGIIDLRDTPRSKRKLNNVVSTSKFNGKKHQVIRGKVSSLSYLF